LETETTKLREEIDEQKKVVKTKQDDYLAVKESNKEAKNKIADKENQIQNQKTFISQRE
jgi:hypothetical protein